MRSARTCRIRPARPRDAFELQRFIRGLSAESRYARFIMGIRERQGLGTSLLSDITTIAGDHAIAYFHVDVLAENQPMRALARKLGWQTNCHPEATSLIRITKSINPPNQSHTPATRK